MGRHVEETDNGIRGTVRIAPAVLIELIELTARATPGVVGFQPRRRVERIVPRPGQTLESDARGRMIEHGGIRVRLDGDRIDAEISIVVGQDVNILETSRLIQRGVGVAVHEMLGMTVTEVNVFVADIEVAIDDA